MINKTHVRIHYGCLLKPVDGSETFRCQRLTMSKVLVHPTAKKPVAVVRYGKVKARVTVRLGTRKDFIEHYDRSRGLMCYEGTNP